MDLRHFRYFVAVAEELHFSRAAERLSISQPPLSKHIQEIERTLGVVLFERNRRRVELTIAGRLFLDEARLVLAQAERALATGRRIAQGEVGKLGIGFTATAAYTPLFPRAVRAFRQALPDVALSLSYMTTDVILDALMHGKLDLGLIRPSATLRLPDGIDALEIVRDRLMLAVHEGDIKTRPNTRVPLESLRNANFILRPRGRGSSFYEQVYDLCGMAGFNPRISQAANEAPTVLGLVAAGLGVSILPASLQAIKVPDVAWRHLSARVGSLESRVYLVQSVEHGSTRQCAHFIDIVKAAVKLS
jgi:DNA-binding transcriptional LysR family regulator